MKTRLIIKQYKPMSEIIERLKDVISHEVDGAVKGYHVADAS